MLRHFHGKKLWKWATAAIAAVTALAGLIKSINAIGEGGRTAAVVANDLLLYTGNIALHVFVILFALGALAAWATKDGKDSATTSDGGGVIVMVLALAGGLYWGITG